MGFSGKDFGCGLGFKIPARGNLLFLRGHQRIKARDLYGVVALLVFPEAENVGHVLRPRRSKKSWFSGHDRAQLGGRRRFQLRMRRYAELPADFRRHARVAAAYGWMPFSVGAAWHSPTIGIKQGYEEIPFRRRHLLKFLG